MTAPHATPPTAPPATPATPPGRWAAALSGLLAAAVALGSAELAAGLVPGARSLVLAVGDAVIDSVPGWLERAVIAALGAADKPVLVVGVLLVCALLGVATGLLARRHRRAAYIGVAAITASGVIASLGDDRTAVSVAALVGAAGVAAGIVVLALLLSAAPPTAAHPRRRRDGRRVHPAPGAQPAGSSAPVRSPWPAPGWVDGCRPQRGCSR